MATVDLTPGTTSQVGSTISASGRTPYFVSQDLDWAKAATAKGSALAAGDIIQLIDLPANTMLIGAGAEVTTVANSTGDEVVTLQASVVSTTYVTAQAVNALGYLAEKTAGDTFGVNAARNTSADTLDIVLGSTGGTSPTSGVVRVFATLMSYDGFDGIN